MRLACFSAIRARAGACDEGLCQSTPPKSPFARGGKYRGSLAYSLPPLAKGGSGGWGVRKASESGCASGVRQNCRQAGIVALGAIHFAWPSLIPRLLPARPRSRLRLLLPPRVLPRPRSRPRLPWEGPWRGRFGPGDGGADAGGVFWHRLLGPLTKWVPLPLAVSSAARASAASFWVYSKVPTGLNASFRTVQTIRIRAAGFAGLPASLGLAGALAFFLGFFS